jgi:hypothetical protein
LVSTSQGLKAGLAAGVIYGVVIGLLHLGTLEVCSSAQLQYIGERLSQLSPPSNETAKELFAADLEWYPMAYGIWALVYGVAFGAIFAAIYLRLPGSNSKRKGMALGIGVLIVGFFIGPASLSYTCTPTYFPTIANIAGIAAAVVYGYVLGVFYDSFGRLHEKENSDRNAGSTLPGATFGPESTNYTW